MPARETQTRTWIFHVVFAVVLGLMACQGLRLIEVDWRDAMVYWEASEHLRDGGADLYAMQEQESDERTYIYPPAFSAMFGPFTFWDDRPDMDPAKRNLLKPYPFPSSLYLWGLLHLLALLAAIGLLSRVVSRCGWDPKVAAALCLAALGTVAMDTHFGNINLFIMLALVGAGALAVRRRFIAAGFVLGFAGMVKIMPFVVIPLLMMRSRWRPAVGGLAGALVAWLLPLGFLIPHHGLLGGVVENVSLTEEFITTWVIPTSSELRFAEHLSYAAPNHSPVAALHRWFGENTALLAMPWDENDYGPLLFPLPGWLLKSVGLGVSVGLYSWACTIVFRRRERARWLLAIGMAFTAASMANVLFWHYHVPGMALVGASVAVRMRRRPNLRQRGLLFFTLCAAGFAMPSVLKEYGLAHFVRVIIWGVPTVSIVAACCIALSMFRRKYDSMAGSSAER